MKTLYLSLKRLCEEIFWSSTNFGIGYADGGGITCEGLLVFKKECQVHYCDLAIIENGEHIVEPWSIEFPEGFGPGDNLYDDFYDDDDEEIHVVKF